jgi:hypothetical protein
MAFARALGMPFALFIQEIGHDGSDVVFDDEVTHRGFHIQECIDVCLRHGFACTEIQGYFGAIPYVGSTEVKPVYSQRVCEERFKYYLDNYSGVIAGHVRRDNGTIVGHAVYWDRNNIYDSRGHVYNLSDTSKYNFEPQTFWILTRMQTNV